MVISIDEEPVNIQDREGQVLPVPGNNVKFDTANDAATAISSRLLKGLRLEPDPSRKIHVKGIGGDMECSMVEISLHIRKHKFTVFAAVDAVAGETDLLIGNDIIDDLINNFDFTLG